MATVWPCVALLTKPAVHGTAYGISVSVLNGALSVFPIITAAILTHTDNNYMYVCLYFAGISGLGALLAVGLTIWDSRTERSLRMPTKAVAEQQKESAEETQPLLMPGGDVLVDEGDDDSLPLEPLTPVSPADDSTC